MYDIDNESETKYLSGVCVGCVCGVCVCVWGVCVCEALGGIGGQMERPHTICQGGWGNGMWGGLAPVRPCSRQYLP